MEAVDEDRQGFEAAFEFQQRKPVLERRGGEGITSDVGDGETAQHAAAGAAAVEGVVEQRLVDEAAGEKGVAGAVVEGGAAREVGGDDVVAEAGQGLKGADVDGDFADRLVGKDQFVGDAQAQKTAEATLGGDRVSIALDAAVDPVDVEDRLFWPQHRRRIRRRERVG